MPTIAAVAAAILLGAAGCSGDSPASTSVEPAGKADPTTVTHSPRVTSPTPQPSPQEPQGTRQTMSRSQPGDEPTTPRDGETGRVEPDEEPGTLPPEAPETTPGEPAEHAFIRHYFDLVTYGQRTGDTGPMLEVSGADCRSCSSVADTIANLHQAGGQRDVAWVVTGIEDDEETKGRYLVGVLVGEHDYVPSAGANATPQPAEPYVLALDLAQQGDSWIVKAYVQVNG